MKRIFAVLVVLTFLFSVSCNNKSKEDKNVDEQSEEIQDEMDEDIEEMIDQMDESEETLSDSLTSEQDTISENKNQDTMSEENE
jgi:uncharacterized membrane-anchored protein YhcB (DUF1043 family)